MQFEYVPKYNNWHTARRWRCTRYVKMNHQVYRKGLQRVLFTQFGSYQLVKHDRLIFWMGWTTHFSKNMEVLNEHLTKPHCSLKQASISCFGNHGPKMLTTSVLMVLFEPFGHDGDYRYLKLTILVF